MAKVTSIILAAGAIPVLTLALLPGTEQPRSNDSIGQLVNSLASHDIELRRRAARALAAQYRDAKPAIPALIKHAKDADADVRLWCVVALERVDPQNERVIRVLASALTDPSKHVRWEALCFFPHRGSEAKPALPALTRILLGQQKENSHHVDRTIAAEAIMRIDPENNTAIPALLEMLRDPNPACRAEAVGTLGKFKERAATAVKSMLTCLKDTDENVRVTAAYALGKIGVKAKDAVPALAVALMDASSKVQVSAAQSLQWIGRDAAPAVPALTTALRSGKEEVKVHVLQALEAIGPAAKRAIPAVLNALSDSESLVRAHAVQSLYRMEPDFGAIPTLLKALKDPDVRVRGNVPAVLAAIADKDKRALPILNKLSKDDDEVIRMAARKALGLND
jgi:HEAT repeat protein